MRGTLTCLALALLLAGGCTSNNDKTDANMGGTGCTRDTDCSEGRICGADVCKVPASTTASGACWSTRECAEGLFCNAQTRRCAMAGSGRIGDGCITDETCTAGLRCDYTGFTGTCRATGTGGPADPCSSQTDCTAGLYCGVGTECTTYLQAFPVFPGVTCAADTGPFHSYFEVPRTAASMTISDFFRLPFPNDARVTDGALDISDFPKPGLTPLGVDVVRLYTDALTADFAGFSPMIPVSFRFSKDLDFDQLQATAGSAVGFIDLSAAPAGSIGGISFGYTPNRNKYACENFLSVFPQLPNAPLKAGHTYTVFIRSAAIRSATGDAPQQDPDLAAVLGPTRPADPDLAHAWDAYDKLRTYLTSKGIDTTDVVNATVFTIGDPKADMERLRQAVATEPAPALSELFLCGSGGTDPCDDGSDARRCGADDPDFSEIHGKLKLPIYQSGTEPYEKVADGGALNIVNGNAVKVRDEDVCFALTIPKGAAPGAGWPLMVYSHGTGGSFRSFISDGVASQMAKASPKVAVFSFDNVGHGARRGSSTRASDELVFNVLNPRAARDNFAQGAADLLTAFKLPSSATPAGWTGPALKFTSKVLFFGHSQGSTHGSLALPFTDSVQAAVFSGAGAALNQSLQYKKQPVDVSQGISFLLGEPLDANHAMLIIWQSFFDRSDPANFNRHIIQQTLPGRSPKHVFMSWGRGDTYSPEITLKINAAFLGVSPVLPFASDDDLRNLPAALTRPVSNNMQVAGGPVTGVVLQYTPPEGVDGHFVATRNTNAISDWTAFVTSFLNTGTPTLP